MVPPDKLEQLQHKCKGQGKKDLYELIGAEGFPNHNALKDRLKRKQDSWGKMAGKAAQLDIIDQALELLKTPADKAEYDRFLRSKPEVQTPPVNPQQGGYQQPERGVLSGLFSAIFFGPIKLYAKLAMFAVGLAILMQLGLMNLLNSSAPTDGEMAGPTSPEPSPTAPLPLAPPPVVEPEPVDPPPPAPPPVVEPEPVDPPPSAPPPVVEPEPVDPPPSAPPPVVEPEPVDPPPPAPPPVIEPVRVGGNVSRPRKTWNLAPEYPRLARLRRIQGTVILELTVDRQGAVSNVSVLRSPEGLVEAAVEAVRQWRYEPTILNGRPVSVIFTETVRFEI